jgi:hypothetical protein
LLPVRKDVPPEALAYQSITAPEGGVALMVTVPASQRAWPTPTGLAGTELTVAVTAK